MSVSSLHVFQQGPVIAALARTAAAAALQRRNGHVPAPPVAPGPWHEAELPPRPEGLVRDYLRHVGGDPSAYRGTLPPHLFPQWSFPLAARTLAGVSYPLARVMNAGCRLEIRAPLPSGEPLQVRARLESVDDDGKRAILVQRVITGTRSAPEALVADMRVFVPLAKKEPGAKKAATLVPTGVKELAFVRLAADAGLDFAKLTGDFNPVHWVAPYARASGFRSCILHGFSTLARAIEAVNRRVFAGDVTRLASIDVRNTAPLVLPARVGVYVADTPPGPPSGRASRGDALWVGDAPGGRAYLEGRFTAKELV
jgi:acyl dehydratase